MGGKLKNKALPVFVRADDNQGAADATPAAAVTTKIGRNEDVNLHKQIQIWKKNTKKPILTHSAPTVPQSPSGTLNFLSSTMTA